MIQKKVINDITRGHGEKKINNKKIMLDKKAWCSKNGGNKEFRRNNDRNGIYEEKIGAEINLLEMKKIS